MAGIFILDDIYGDLIPPAYDSTLNQLHLSWLYGANPHAFDFAFSGVEHFKAEAVIFNDFAFLRDTPRQFANQACHRSCIPAFMPNPE